jgi:hypothetical protein
MSKYSTLYRKILKQRATALSIAATHVASDIKAAGRYEKGISRSNRISKELSRRRIRATCNT